MLRHSFALVLLIATSGHAAPGEDHWSGPATASATDALSTVKAMIEAEEFAAALPLLRTLAEKQPGNADVFNYLGYAHRKTGSLDRSGEAYARALRIDPHHLGALEYQGELFLMRGEMAKAKANLARLKAICGEECEEAEELGEAIAANGGGG